MNNFSRIKKDIKQKIHVSKMTIRRLQAETLQQVAAATVNADDPTYGTKCVTGCATCQTYSCGGGC